MMNVNLTPKLSKPTLKYIETLRVNENNAQPQVSCSHDVVLQLQLE